MNTKTSIHSASGSNVNRRLSQIARKLAKSRNLDTDLVREQIFDAIKRINAQTALGYLTYNGVLDLNLPRLDGLSVLQRLRAEGVPTPILVLTARSAWLQRVEGIDAGADDYLTKPFHMEELVARISALLRRVAGHATPILAVGDLHIDTRRLRALRNGRAIDLTPLEFRLLRYLAHNRGRVVSHFDIAEHVYRQDREPDNNAIEALVARLRRKIGGEAIATRRGHGYVIEA